MTGPYQCILPEVSSHSGNAAPDHVEMPEILRMRQQGNSLLQGPSSLRLALLRGKEKKTTAADLWLFDLCLHKYAKVCLQYFAKFPKFFKQEAKSELPCNGSSPQYGSFPCSHPLSPN